MARALVARAFSVITNGYGLSILSRTALLVVIFSLLVPAAANADVLQFTGRSGVQRGVFVVPGQGSGAYRIAGTIDAAVYSRGRSNYVAKASVGIYYSTEALPDGVKLVYSLQYRKRGGKWRSVCSSVSRRCTFFTREQAPWPGEPAGGQYFDAELTAARARNIQEVRLRWGPLFERERLGAWAGWARSKVFKVRYYRGSGVLPSQVNPASPPAGDEPDAPEPAPEPEPQPAPQPQPVPAQDTCVGHPSDSSVVCTRGNGRIVDVCDRDPDGHRAYARVVTEATYPNFQSPFYDSNDSKPGCSNIPFASRVTSIAVCVQYEGCSPFKQTGPQPAAARR